MYIQAAPVDFDVDIIWFQMFNFAHFINLLVPELFFFKF